MNMMSLNIGGIIRCIHRTRRVQMFIDGMNPCTFDPYGVVPNGYTLFFYKNLIPSGLFVLKPISITIETF